MADSNSRLFSQGYNGPDCVKQHQHSNSNAVAIPMTTELRFQSAQLDFSPTIACTTYPYNDPYFSGVLTSYPPPAMVHPNMLGMQHARMPLPLEMTEEPVYVNAKQYHGILRRRQLRAKAESENKLLKTRKPYLHESRHLHAMKRARGCGGRFLNTKKLDEAKESAENRKMSDTNASTGSSSGSEVIQSDVNVRKDIHRICDKSGLEVSSAVESRKNETNYSFSQSNEPYSNLYHNSHFHISAFHPLQSRNEEGNSGQNGGMFSGGSQHRAVVIQ